MGKPSEDDDGIEEIELNDGSDTGDGDEEEDRGDVVNPEETEENLKDLADEDEEDEQPEKAGKGIPKPRFDEVNEKRIRAEERARLAEEELARLRGDKKADKADDKPAFDYDAKEEAYMDALMEGDKDAAKKLRREIDEARRAEFEEAATTKAEARMLQRQAATDLNAAAQAVIEEFPFLDSKSVKANKAAIAEVVEWRDFYISKGHGAADALLKAAEKVGPGYKPRKASEGEDEDDAPKAKTKLDELRAMRLRKNAAAANRQPARLEGGVGNRGTGGKLNVEEMDEDAFASLTEKEKARMRGDAV